MKKTLFLITLLVFGYGVLNTRFNNYKAINEKIIFEDNLSYHDMSLQESKDTEINGRSVYVQLHLDYNKKSKKVEIDDNATVEEIKEARKQRREELSKYYYKNNKDRVSGFDLKRSRSVYVSKYAPIIEYDYTYEDYSVQEDKIVDMIINDDSIEKAVIGYSDKKVEDEMAVALYDSNAYDYYYDRTLTGEDVTIGILESGIMDTSHSNFTNTDCSTYNHILGIDSVTEHATMTASIIGGSGGCVPDAKLLSAAGHGTYVDEIEWMLDNDVNIINMSFGESLTFGTRSSRTEYVDYIIQQYDVCVVAASGNTDSGTNYKVANPGMAYNAITVGSVDSSGFTTSYSKYQVTTGMPKPTVVVEGNQYDIPGFDEAVSGTSCSTALVTGMVAMFMDNYYILTVQIPRIMSLLCNSAYFRLPNTYTRDLINGFNEEQGAGIVSLSDALDISRYGQTLTNDGTATYGVIYKEPFTLVPNTRYRFSIAWFHGERGVQGSTAHTPYKLLVTDGSGNEIYRSSMINSNIQVLDFTPNFTMDVYLRVIQVSGYELISGAEEVYLSQNMNSLT